jgi:hypothetical protein
VPVLSAHCFLFWLVHTPVAVSMAQRHVHNRYCLSDCSSGNSSSAASTTTVEDVSSSDRMAFVSYHFPFSSSHSSGHFIVLHFYELFCHGDVLFPSNTYHLSFSHISLVGLVSSHINMAPSSTTPIVTSTTTIIATQQTHHSTPLRSIVSIASPTSSNPSIPAPESPTPQTPIHLLPFRPNRPNEVDFQVQ